MSVVNKSYFKNVKTLNEFETKAKKLLRDKEAIIEDLKENYYYKKLLEEVNMLPTSYIYFNKEKLMKEYCPVCGHRATKPFKAMSRHTCDNNDIENGFGYKDIKLNSNNFTRFLSFSPFGYSDVIMTVAISFSRFFDDSLASIDEGDFLVCEKSYFKTSFRVYDIVIGYSDKHKLRTLNSNEKISDNLSILKSHFTSYKNYISYDYLGGIEAIKKTLDFDMLNYIYRRDNSNQLDLFNNINEITSKIIKDAYMRNQYDRESKRRYSKKRKVESYKINIDYNKIYKSINMINLFYMKKKYEINNNVTYDVLCSKCCNLFEFSYHQTDSISDIPIMCSCGNYADNQYSTNVLKRYSYIYYFVTDVIDGEYVQIMLKLLFNMDDNIDINDMTFHDLIGVSVVKLTKVENVDGDLEVVNYVPLNELTFNLNDDLDNKCTSVFIKSLKKNEVNYNYRSSVLYGGYGLMDQMLSDILSSNIKYSGYDYLIKGVFQSILEQTEEFLDIELMFDISLDGSYISYWIKYPKIERYVKNPILFETFYNNRIYEIFNYGNFNRFINLNNDDKNVINIRKDAYAFINDIYSNKSEGFRINNFLLNIVSRLDSLYELKGKKLYKEEIYTLLDTLKYQFYDYNLRYEDMFIRRSYRVNDNIVYPYNDMDNMIDNVIEIIENNNITYNQLSNYCNNVFYNQCIKPKETLQIWNDYLFMVNYLEYDKTKEVIYPRSLKKEHDIATFAFNSVKSKYREDVFKKNISNFAHLTYSGEKYSVIIPKSTTDLVREGRNLNHCVASYILKITEIRGVLFIRKNSDLNASFYTMEINNGAIVQVSGFANSKPIDDIVNFLHKYAKLKNLKCRF